MVIEKWKITNIKTLTCKFYYGVITLFISLLSINLFAADYPKIAGKSAAILDLTSGQWIYLKDADSKRSPASTVKLLTAMVVLDKMKPDMKISVPASAAKIPPYKMNLLRGETHKISELLEAMLLRSYNDVAHTLAIGTYGSESSFARVMNIKAKSIGASNAHFVNPHGLPHSSQRVTAKELALITAYTRNYPLITEILRTKSKMFQGPGKKETNLVSRNKLLLQGFHPEVLGKTGFTNCAGRCFAGYIEKIKTPVVIVVLNSSDRWGDVKVLSKWAFNYYHNKIKINKTLLKRDKVMLYQKVFNEIGLLNTEIDGVFGTTTEMAVLKFQGTNNLTVDGILGEETQTLLEKIAVGSK